MSVVPRQAYGWGGTVGGFLSSAPEGVRSSLEQHLLGLLGSPASGSQKDAWTEEEALVRESLRGLAIARPDVVGWGIALEYELPLEGGRRPDIVLHSGDKLFVLEFKQSDIAAQAAVDQVSAYARDLAEYHQASHALDVEPVLVLTKADGASRQVGDVPALAPKDLAAYLLHEASPHGAAPDFDAWLEAPYEPLPSLIDAARMIFREEPLPYIRSAQSAGIPEAVALLSRLAKEAERDSSRKLALLAGVPGAGKTLTGLQLVYDRVADRNDAVFLSGNGPLVQVLRDALKSRTFVQDLHAFVTTYGRTEKTPSQHIIVFDEAQRAWDRGYMAYNGRGDRSEPDVLIQVGERLPGWCSLVGLVGDGQEIHSGEEAGIGQWNEALEDEAQDRWTIHCPPRLSGEFDACDVELHPELDLTVSLRSRRAAELHAWVGELLDGCIDEASETAQRISDAEFQMFVTRDLHLAKKYLIDRYGEEPAKRYGVLASSKSQRLLPPFGVDSSFPATKKVKYGDWYNRPRGEPGSGCNLDTVVTEFGCQGLELDMPLIAWADDLKWLGSRWEAKPGWPKYRQDDPEQLRINCYRVLLTRGRDGFIVFVPPTPVLDPTAHALLAAGVRRLPSS
ncbi:MAG TPA: DNA/RNA helicase domain-containing protein [Nocardioides sp.]|nr:DNA/RNA helicase domain-containing protein [Nocardioides sp.]